MPEPIFPDTVDPDLARELRPHFWRLAFVTYDGSRIVVTTVQDRIGQAIRVAANYDESAWATTSDGKVHMIFGLDSNFECYSPRLTMGVPWGAAVELAKIWYSQQRLRYKTVLCRRLSDQQGGAFSQVIAE